MVISQDTSRKTVFFSSCLLLNLSDNKASTQMIKSVEGSAGLLHKITKPAAWRGGAQILEKAEEDVRRLDRCEAKRKEWAKRWQCDESVQNMEDKAWKIEELKELEEALSRLKERELETASRLIKEQDAMASTPEFPWIRQQKQEEKWRNSWKRWKQSGKWKMAKTSLHDDVLLDDEE